MSSTWIGAQARISWVELDLEAPETEPFRNDPRGLRHQLESLLRDTRSYLDALYFDGREDSAYALVAGPDNDAAAATVAGRLGAKGGYGPLLTVDEAAAAVEGGGTP